MYGRSKFSSFTWWYLLVFFSLSPHHTTILPLLKCETVVFKQTWKNGDIKIFYRVNHLQKWKASWQGLHVHMLICPVFHCCLATVSKRAFDKARAVNQSLVLRRLSIRIIRIYSIAACHNCVTAAITGLRRKWEIHVPIQLCNYLKSCWFYYDKAIKR